MPRIKKTLEYVGGTVGTVQYHENMSSPKLVQVQYYSDPEKPNEIILIAVSGHNLSPITCVPRATITVDEFNDRDHDYYNDLVEHYWALRVLDFDI